MRAKGLIGFLADGPPNCSKNLVLKSEHPTCALIGQKSIFYKLIKQKKRVLLFFTTVPLNHNLIIAIHKTEELTGQANGSTDYALTCL
mgnify:CR=1 FL=1